VAEIFKESEFIHLGGDEVMKETCWKPDPHVQELMKKEGFTTTQQVFTYFLNRVDEEIQEATGKKVAFWSESASLDIKRSEDQILQYWTYESDLQRFMDLYPKNPKIFSPDDYFYFDVGLGNRYGDNLGKFYPTWTHMATFEPAHYISPGDDTVMGGEACMFSELNTGYNIWEKLFPRLALFSDVFWGPEKTTFVEWEGLTNAIMGYKAHMEDMGYPTDKISSRYCEQNLNECFAPLNAQIEEAINSTPEKKEQFSKIRKILESV
jgi:N-acetyl-beta-hexosaminidase